MRTLIVCLISFTLSHSAYSQRENDAIFKKADIRRDYSFNQLVAYANNEFSEKEDIARFFYYWISLNIAYDNSITLEDISHSKSVAESVQANVVFKNRNTTCIGFVNLYEAFLKHFDIEHRLVVGYTRQANNTLLNIEPRIDHAWSAIKYDKKWHNVEITWAGALIKDKKLRNYYFDMPPARLTIQHLPKEPKWQFSEVPLSLEEFNKKPIIDPWYIAQTGTDSPILSVEKTGKDELVINCIKPKSWKLLLSVVDHKNEPIKALKYKVRKNGKNLCFTIKDYDGSSILRLDAKRIGKDNVSFSAAGLAYLSPANLQSFTGSKARSISKRK